MTHAPAVRYLIYGCPRVTLASCQYVHSTIDQDPKLFFNFEFFLQEYLLDTAQKRLNDAFRTRTNAGRIRQQNEAKIIKAAEIEFAQNGYKGTSLNAVADRADLPKSNILYYFKSKFGLYGAVLADILEMWNQAFSTASVDSDPAETLYRYIEAKVAYSYTHPLASRIFAMEIIQGAPHLEAFLATDLKVWLDDRASVIQSWIDAGKMKAVNPHHLIFLIWGSTQHYADFSTQVCWALGKKEYDQQDFQDATATVAMIVLGGLGLTIPTENR
jgi:TetR/AcrR family transcriptional regulator